jgi:hypothetical protein
MRTRKPRLRQVSHTSDPWGVWNCYINPSSWLFNANSIIWNHHTLHRFFLPGTANRVLKILHTINTDTKIRERNITHEGLPPINEWLSRTVGSEWIVRFCFSSLRPRNDIECRSSLLCQPTCSTHSSLTPRSSGGFSWITSCTKVSPSSSTTMASFSYQCEMVISSFTSTYFEPYLLWGNTPLSVQVGTYCTSCSWCYSN